MAEASELFRREIVTPAVATSPEHRDALWRAHFEHLFHLRTLHAHNLLSVQDRSDVNQQQRIAFNQHVPLPHQNQVVAISVPSTASVANAFPMAVDGSSDATRPLPMNQMPNGQARNIQSSYQSVNPRPNAQDQRLPPRSHNPPTIVPFQRVQYPAGNTLLTPVQYQHLALSPNMPGNFNPVYNPDTRPVTPSTTTAVQVQRSRPRPTPLMSNPTPQPPAAVTSGRFFPANPQDVLSVFAQPAPERRAIHQADTHSPTYC